jgi:hypothetical protein
MPSRKAELLRSLFQIIANSAGTEPRHHKKDNHMGRYRKVDVRIWNDARFGSLSDDGKLAFLFMLTHPHLSGLGCMRATVAGLAAELGWPAERFATAVNELVSTGNDGRSLVEYDEQASFIGLPKFQKYNQPENPNVVTGWGSLLDLLPECLAKERLIDRVDQCVRERGERFLAAWETVSGTVPETVCQTVSKGLAESSRSDSGESLLNSENGMPNQKQEQEQEPEQNPEKKDAADAAGGLTKSTKRSAKNQEPVPIPDALDTTEALKALDEFKEHRRQLKKSLTSMAETKLLAEWSSKGAGRFVAAVDYSIANGWQGLFEPQNGAAKQSSRIEPPPGKYDDDSDIVDLTNGGQNK